MAFAHIAMRSDAARGAKGLACLKSFAHLCNGSAYLKAKTERLDAFLAKRVELFAPQRNQLILFVHLRRANVKASREMNSVNQTLSVEALKRQNVLSTLSPFNASTDQVIYWFANKTPRMR